MKLKNRLSGVLLSVFLVWQLLMQETIISVLWDKYPANNSINLLINSFVIVEVAFSICLFGLIFVAPILIITGEMPSVVIEIIKSNQSQIDKQPKPSIE